MRSAVAAVAAVVLLVHMATCLTYQPSTFVPIPKCRTMGTGGGSIVDWWFLVRTHDSEWLYGDAEMSSLLEIPGSQTIADEHSPLYNTIGSIWGLGAYSAVREISYRSGYLGYVQTGGSNHGLVGWADNYIGATRERRGFVLRHDMDAFPPRRDDTYNASSIASAMQNPVLGDWRWFGDSVDGGYFVCMNLDSEEAIDQVLQHAAFVRSTVVVDSALEPTRPGSDVAHVVADKEFPSSTEYTSACDEDLDACMQSVEVVSGATSFSLLALNPNMRLDSCITVSHWEEFAPSLSRVSLTAENHLPDHEENDVVPFQSFAVLTLDNADEERFLAEQALQPTHLRKQLYYPVCLGEVALSFRGTGVGSAAVCVHHEELFRRMRQGLRTIEADCQPVLSLISTPPDHLAAYVQALSVISGASSGAGGLHISNAEKAERRRLRAFTHSPIPGGTKPGKATTAASDENGGATEATVTVTMHEGGAGELFSITSGGRVYFVNSGADITTLDRAIGDLQSDEDDFAFDMFAGLLVTSELPEYSSGMIEVSDGEWKFSEKLTEIIDADAIHRTTNFRFHMNSLFADGIDVAVAMTEELRSKEWKLGSVDSKTQQTLAGEIMFLLHDIYCEAGQKITKRQYEPSTPLVEDQRLTNIGDNVTAGVFYGDTLDFMFEAGTFQLEFLSPYKEEFYCLGVTDAVVGVGGIFSHWEQYLVQKTGKEYFANLTVAEIDELKDSFSELPIDGEDYGNLGETWKPRKFDADGVEKVQSNEYGEFHGSTLYHTSLIPVLSSVGSSSVPIGLFGSSGMPRKILYDPEKEGKRSMSLSFFVMPQFGSADLLNRDLLSKVKAKYYLIGGGDETSQLPHFNMLKLLLDSRRELKNGRCVNNDAIDDDFWVIFQHNALYADEDVNYRFRVSADYDCSILELLLYACPLDRMKDWENDDELMEICRYSPACRKYGLGYVGSDRNRGDTKPPAFSLDITRMSDGSTETSSRITPHTGVLLDCNEARSGKYSFTSSSCETFWEYDILKKRQQQCGYRDVFGSIEEGFLDDSLARKHQEVQTRKIEEDRLDRLARAKHRDITRHLREDLKREHGSRVQQQELPDDLKLDRFFPNPLEYEVAQTELEGPLGLPELFSEDDDLNNYYLHSLFNPGRVYPVPREREPEFNPQEYNIEGLFPEDNGFYDDDPAEDLLEEDGDVEEYIEPLFADYVPVGRLSADADGPDEPSRERALAKDDDFDEYNVERLFAEADGPELNPQDVEKLLPDVKYFEERKRSLGTRVREAIKEFKTPPELPPKQLSKVSSKSDLQRFQDLLKKFRKGHEARLGITQAELRSAWVGGKERHALSSRSSVEGFLQDAFEKSRALAEGDGTPIDTVSLTEAVTSIIEQREKTRRRLEDNAVAFDRAEERSQEHVNRFGSEELFANELFEDTELESVLSASEVEFLRAVSARFKRGVPL